MAWLGLVLLIVCLPLLVWFWISQLRTAWLVKKAADVQVQRGDRRASTEATATTATMDLGRDTLLAVLTIGGVVVGIARLVSSVNTSGLGGSSMHELPSILQRVLVALVAFLIVYGLSSAVLPQIFPDKRGKLVLSEATAVALAAIVALYAGTTKSVYEDLLKKMVSGSLGIVSTFLGILFAAIGAYLVWKKVTVLFRPTGSTRMRSGSGSNQDGRS